MNDFVKQFIRDYTNSEPLWFMTEAKDGGTRFMDNDELTEHLTDAFKAQYIDDDQLIDAVHENLEEVFKVVRDETDEGKQMSADQAGTYQYAVDGIREHMLNYANRVPNHHLAELLIDAAVRILEDVDMDTFKPHLLDRVFKGNSPLELASKYMDRAGDVLHGNEWDGQSIYKWMKQVANEVASKYE